MSMHYGTKLEHYSDLNTAEDAAIARHADFYVDAVGWLFRVVGNQYSAIQPYADPVSGDGAWYTTPSTLELFAFPVVRWTPCGATIWDIHGKGGKRSVHLSCAVKHYASRTAREAIKEFYERRVGQLYILAKQVRRAEREKALAERWLGATA